MIFNKITKQAFVHPAKTGTFTIWHFLMPLGWKTIPKVHALTESLINDYPNLNNYTIYGFLRDPLKRFESSVLYIKQRMYGKAVLIELLNEQGVTDSVETVSYETLINIFPSVIKKFPVLFDPQTAWLDHAKVTTLDFDNIESELRRISGNTEQPIVRHNTSTDFGRSVITDKVRAFVRDYYAADYALAKDRLGKEY